MKLNKLLLIVTFGILLTAVKTTYAQRGGGRMKQNHERFEARLDTFSQKLNLSNEQREKVKVIMKDTRTEAKAIIQKNSSKEDRRPKMMDLAIRTDAKIKAILDPKQQEIYQQLKAERMQKRREMKQDKEMRMEMDDAGLL